MGRAGRFVNRVGFNSRARKPKPLINPEGTRYKYKCRVQFFDRMKQEKRFHTDVWGVQLNFKQAIQQVRQDNYSKAEKWLEGVKQSEMASGD